MIGASVATHGARMPRILLADDDVELVQLFTDYLEQEGFTVAAVHDGAAAVEAALAGGVDLAVLDVMMPRLSGIDALRRIREHGNLPVLMLTARGDDIDRILGLELGADDYVPKPCMPRELVARIRAILRRTAAAGAGNGAANGAAGEADIVAGKLVVHPSRRSAAWDGRPVNLTGTEYRLLEVLARNAGRPVSKQDLSEQGLGRPLQRFDRSIDVHLSSIRHKLGNLADGRSCIQTVFRLGYQLIHD